MNTSFERVSDGKDEYLTPPYIIKALGEFDLDPCSPIKRPWDTAKNHFSIEDDGLSKEWGNDTRIWLNPPYGSETNKWMKKLSEHNNGIALIFARTETQTFFKWIWPKASGIMFLKGRLKFFNVNGTLTNNCAGAPSCLVAYGLENSLRLMKCEENGDIKGKYLPIYNGEN